MSNRIVNDPAAAGWTLDPATGYWMWSAGSGGGGGGGGSYDDTEVRGLISDNSDRITALENDTGGGSFWVEESPGVIKYTGTAKATDVIATG